MLLTDVQVIFSLFLDKDGKERNSKDKSNAGQLAVPRLSVCADAQKVDRAKLAQTEFTIIEFDPDTFRVLLDYLHTGSCPLTCVSIPGKKKYYNLLHTVLYFFDETQHQHFDMFLILCVLL